MQNHPAAPDDEISLFDLWQTLVRRKWWVLGIPLLAVIAAAVAVTFMKPQWEATATIQIGAVGQAGQLIEPPARVVERMKLKSFEDAVLAGIGLSGQKTPEAKLYRGSLKVKALPNTDLIEIKVRGYSRESAKRSIEATVDYLHRIHQGMAAPTVQRIKQLLAQAEREIAKTKAEQEKALKIMGLKDKTITEARFMENIVLTNIMIQRDNELRGLEQAKTSYEEQLDPMRTYPTSYIEKISVSEGPVAPKKSLIVVLVGMLGLFLGVMAAFLSNAFQAHKH